MPISLGRPVGAAAHGTLLGRSGATDPISTTGAPELNRWQRPTLFPCVLESDPHRLAIYPAKNADKLSPAAGKVSSTGNGENSAATRPSGSAYLSGPLAQEVGSAIESEPASRVKALFG
jgi:hypothetical protein